MSCFGKGGPRSEIDRVAKLVCALLAPLVLGLAMAAGAAAAPAAPHWSIISQSEPSHFKVGDEADAYRVIVRNDGALPTSRKSAVTVADVLPKGVSATKASARAEGGNGNGSPRYDLSCSTEPVACTYEESPRQGQLPPGTTIVMTVTVSVAGNAEAALENSVSVSGGGAPSASISESTPVSPEAAPFGLSYLTTAITDESGEADTQAGSHPFELTTSLAFGISSREVPSAENGGGESPLSDTAPKDLEVALPPGLVGDPNAVPRCAQQEFQAQEGLDCPLDTQVGTLTLYFYGAFHSSVVPVYDVVPPPGQPIELGFTIARIGHIPLFFQLRDDAGSGHDEYRLVARLNDIPETGPLQGGILTLWGVPANGSHDLEREGTTGQGRQQNHEFCRPFVNVERGVEERCPSGVAAKPFLTLPSSCQSGTLPFGVFTDSWQGRSEGFPAAGQPRPTLGPLTGCERLSFSPLLAAQPESAQAGAPSGYTVQLHIPQNEDPSELSTPDVRKAVVTLPAGTVLSPSVANGLQACSEEQFGLHDLTASSCPAASSIGTVQIATPLLPGALEGQLYLGKPACEQCSASDAQAGRLVHLLVQAQGFGVTVKLLGSVSIDQSTGQLTATFAQAPQLPWEELTLTLDGGPGAPLANPSTCGIPLAATAQLTPYSMETPVQRSSQPFQLSGCSPPQFNPSFIAGTTNNQAAAFSPLTVTLSRTDHDENLERIAVRLPPGLLGMLAKVPRCAEAQAQAGACGPQSQIGSVSVGAGPGPNPFFLAGRVYLTGPYAGAPFGLSIVVPAIAGPLNLGAIDVRAAIEMDPMTGALSIASDPLPQSLDGVPLQIKTVNLYIEREGFIFNPTNCRRLAVAATLTSAQGATVTQASPFQAANCATLPFKPRLTALTHAYTSKASGVYLHVKVVSGPGQANIAKLKVNLPKQLPSRLQTLHHACPAAVFEANPARCPAAAVVGTATVVTPVLNNPLSGPAYLVSHGGAAFPDLQMVLQGEGVVLRLDGQTSIGQGITSSTFRSLPDAPISTFDLVLDAGARSVLAANLPAKAKGSMCKQRLAMPTAITGQNGAVVKQTTIIAVSGCRRAKPHRRHGRAGRVRSVGKAGRGAPRA